LQNCPKIYPIYAGDLNERNPILPHERFFLPCVVDFSLGIKIMDADAPCPDTVPLQEEQGPGTVTGGKADLPEWVCP